MLYQIDSIGILKLYESQRIWSNFESYPSEFHVQWLMEKNGKENE